MLVSHVPSRAVSRLSCMLLDYPSVHFDHWISQQILVNLFHNGVVRKSNCSFLPGHNSPFAPRIKPYAFCFKPFCFHTYKQAVHFRSSPFWIDEFLGLFLMADILCSDLRRVDSCFCPLLVCLLRLYFCPNLALLFTYAPSSHFNPVPVHACRIQNSPILITHSKAHTDAFALG